MSDRFLPRKSHQVVSASVTAVQKPTVQTVNSNSLNGPSNTVYKNLISTDSKWQPVKIHK